MRIGLSAFFLVLLLSGLALGDGKVFWRETVPPGIPYQRAIILFHEGQETLILQSRFDAAGRGPTNAAFGWVVPVPAVPDLASTNAGQAANWFRRADRLSHPESFPMVLALLIGLSGVSLLLLLGGLLMHLPVFRAFRPRYAPFFRFGYVGFVLCALLCVVLPTLMSAGGGPAGVEVLRAQDVGIYEAKVIKADDSAGLVSWLHTNGFRYGLADLPVLDQYVRSNWCFVVARIKDVPEAVDGAQTGGLLDPLILSFPTRQAIYPTALTATIGSSTEILIYLVSDQKLICRERLPLRFAGPYRMHNLAEADDGGLSVLGCKQAWRDPPVLWLMKFKGTMTSAQMQQDLRFEAAGDGTPYRERRVVFW